MPTIKFFSEIGTREGLLFPRTYPNMRTDVAWSVALNAPILAFDSENFTGDLGILIIPKNNPSKAFKFYGNNRNKCKYWAVMQEADQIGWQRYSVPDQIEYLNLLNSVDLIFCHNEMDKIYFEGLIPGKKVSRLASLMIEDAIPPNTADGNVGVMINGNWTDWYSAQDSYMIAQEFECPIFAPSMGRKQVEENSIDGINYLPYMKWSEWMVEFSMMGYAVNCMRTFAAGTFSLNAAYFGIPCLGWNGCDTQRICFPELSFDVGDMVSMREAAQRLKGDDRFYEYCSGMAVSYANLHFSENTFLRNFSENIAHLGI